MTFFEQTLPAFRLEIWLVGLACILACPHLFAHQESNEALLQELRNRDAIIADLLRRVEGLERQVSGESEKSKSQSSQSSQSGQSTAGQGRATPPAATVASAPQQSTAAPGEVIVDERAADRALERTLTIQGALLLPQGVRELVPYTSYARREIDFPELLSFQDSVIVGSQRVERDEFTLGIRGSIGLPYDSQLEINIPYRWVNETRARTVTGIPLEESDDYGTSIGDIKLGIAKTFMREDGWKPDLLGRLTWDSASGESIDNGVSLGDGFDDFRFSLTALKRQDPLAFTATLSYSHTLEKDDVQPGDEYGFSIGASMAASPATSLSIAFAQSFQREVKLDGSRVDGSSGDSALLIFGASSVLGQRTVLAVSAGIGLTRVSPDYTLNFSLPIRYW